MTQVQSAKGRHAAANELTSACIAALPAMSSQLRKAFPVLAEPLDSLDRGILGIIDVLDGAAG